jgi:Tol biopolymer transport system component
MRNLKFENIDQKDDVMINTTKPFFILLLSIAALFFISNTTLSQQTAEQLFEKALYMEEATGDLEQAIDLFQQILEEFPDNREIAAKSLLHLGICYEKQGLKQARGTYQDVINKYPDRQGEVTLAKERLNRLLALQEVPSKPTFRKIRIPTKITWNARLSPDGQRLILASDEKLWSIPLTGQIGTDFPGVPIELNTGVVPVENSGLAWSGDGKWIAFNDCEYYTNKELEGMQGIHIVSAEGGEPKELIEVWRDVRIVSTGISLSPMGKTLAFSSVEDKKQHIFTISTDGGESKQLVEAQAREPVFSPDGKMIAYVEDKNAGRAGGGLWVVPAAGGAAKLVAEAGMASSPIWSPNGDMIAFVDYEDEDHIYIIPIARDGEVTGDVITIDAPERTGGIRLLAGWTPDNKIGLIIRSLTEFGLYTLPVKGGKAAQVLHGGYPGQPRWSPDGKRIFHTNNKDEESGDWEKFAIGSIPAEGGKVVTVPILSDVKIVISPWGAGNNVSPDGKMIAFTAQTKKDTSWHWQLWTLPVNGGTPIQLTNSPARVIHGFPCWSPDGKNIAFVRATTHENYTKGMTETNIFVIPAAGGDPKPMTIESDSVRFSSIAWSPDGNIIAYFSYSEVNPDDMVLKIISVENGSSRVIARVQGLNVHNELAWSPDSKQIAFNGPKDIISVVSLNDGSIEEIKTDLQDVDNYHFDWSPDGDKFVFAGYQGDNPEFWLMGDFLPNTEANK